MDKLGPGDPRQIGAYRLLARLGAGGMGQVFLARSDRGRTVAVKLIRRELAAQEEFRARFRQEVGSARRVGGYWTAPVLDADTEAPVPWVATGYVAGPSLQQVVGHDHGALPERSVRILAAGLAHALKDIHAAGIVHRDLKPSNVLVTIDGPRVIDFGIARALETLAGDGLTRTGSLVGSPGFMAPEQVRGDRVTPACDVFCLGSVLAYAATGVLPFGGANSGVHALMFRIAQEEPDLEGMPEGIADLVRDCLRKDPAARPSLDRILERTGAEDTVSGGRSRDPWLPGALVAQLGRHAVRLLEVEDPQSGPDTDTRDAGGEGGAPGPVAGAAGAGASAWPGGPAGPGAAAGGGAPAGPGAPGFGGAPVGAGAGGAGGAPGPVAGAAGAGASAWPGGPAGPGAAAGGGAPAGPGAPGFGGAPVGAGAGGAGGAPGPVAGAGASAWPGGPAGPAAAAGTGGQAGAAAPGGAQGAAAGAGAFPGAGGSVGPGASAGADGQAGPGAPAVGGVDGALGSAVGAGGSAAPTDRGVRAGSGAPAGEGAQAGPGAGGPGGAQGPAAGAGAWPGPAAPTVPSAPAGPGAQRSPGDQAAPGASPGARAAGAGGPVEHSPVADDAPTPPPPGGPGGGGAAVGHLPTLVAGQTPPPGAPPAYGTPAPYGYGYPQQAQQHPQPPSAGYGYPQQPYTPYGGPGSTPPYGPPPFTGQPEPERPGGRSTALLVVIALVVALGAGGSVYALMKHGGGDTAGGTVGPAPTGTRSAPPVTSSAPTPSPSAPASSAAADGAVPAAYLGTWETTIDNTGGTNTRRLTIGQGEVGDKILTLVADGPGEGGGTYHCVFEATLAEQPGDGGPLEIGPSTVTSGEPMSSCSPGEATEVTLLPDGRLKRAKAGGGESLTYTKQ
ncbi:serine/threonine-protein kinase [Streptomyces sp. NPDC093248]|uniref:serine/threonine-protein kinase n=1 Tax=Streptomyces sp. NPDC093248 TaxID=3155072 RepID=UPI00343B244B